MGVDESLSKTYYVDEIAIGGRKTPERCQEELVVQISSQQAGAWPVAGSRLGIVGDSRALVGGCIRRDRFERGRGSIWGWSAEPARHHSVAIRSRDSISKRKRPSPSGVEHAARSYTNTLAAERSGGTISECLE